MPRIYDQKNGTLTESERLELGRLLLKAGYTVTIGRERPPSKDNGKYIRYVEYDENQKR